MSYLNRSFIATLLAGLLISCTIQANATSTKVKIIDGVAYVDESSNSSKFETFMCNETKFSVFSYDLEGSQPDIILTAGNPTVGPSSFVRLIEEIRKLLSNQHTVAGMEIGCMTDDGGLGMIITSLSADIEAQYIQVTNEGRVISGFNKTGHNIIQKDD